MFNFQDKVVLAIGGAGYLCSPGCREMAKAGAKVIVTDIDAAKAEGLAAEMGSDCLGLTCDISDTSSIDELLSKVIEKYGRLDVVINAAFKGSHGDSLADMPAEAFSAAAHVQLTGTFHLAREAAKLMPNGGTMVFFSSMYGRVAPDPSIYHAPMLPNPIDYGVVKAGLDQMIRYLAVHYAPQNIRVNGIAPGSFPHPGNDAGFVERLAAKSPMNRVGRAEEMGGPLVFLASDAASFVTGQILVVDGGWTIW